MSGALTCPEPGPSQKKIREDRPRKDLVNGEGLGSGLHRAARASYIAPQVFFCEVFRFLRFIPQRELINEYHGCDVLSPSNMCTRARDEEMFWRDIPGSSKIKLQLIPPIYLRWGEGGG